LSLPAQFRILRNFIIEPLEYSVPNVWAGRAERIFVIVPQETPLDGKAQAMLRSFTGYSFDNWRQTKLDGMIIYIQFHIVCSQRPVNLPTATLDTANFRTPVDAGEELARLREERSPSATLESSRRRQRRCPRLTTSCIACSDLL